MNRHPRLAINTVPLARPPKADLKNPMTNALSHGGIMWDHGDRPIGLYLKTCSHGVYLFKTLQDLATIHALIWPFRVM